MITSIAVGIGIILLVAGLVLLAKPATFSGFLARYRQAMPLYVSAIIVRFAIGLFFIAAASSSQYPMAVNVLGYIAVTAALVLAMVGHLRFTRMLEWVTELPDIALRGISLLALALGVFVVHAFAGV